MTTRTQLALEIARSGTADPDQVAAVVGSELKLEPNSRIPAIDVVSADERTLRCRTDAGNVALVSAREILTALEREESIYCLLLSSFLDDSLRESVTLAELDAVISMANTSRSVQLTSDFTVSVEARRTLESVRVRGETAIVGRSSSGKSLIAKHVERMFVGAGGWVLWLALSRPGQKAIAYYAAAVSGSGPAIDRLLIVDDVQGAPHVATRLVRIWKFFGDPPARLLLATWPDGASIIREIVPSDAVVSLSGFQTARQIAASLDAPWGVREEILAIADGDALVAALAAENYASTGQICSASELSLLGYEHLAGGQHLSSSEALTLYTIACLASYEIEVDPKFLDPVMRRGIDRLVHLEVLRSASPYVHLGHRSLARLVALHLKSHGQTSPDLSPVAVAVRYLQNAGPTQIQQTLDRLDLVAISGQDDQFGAAFLAESWSNLRVLVGLLSRQVESDPTWGDNVASAVFAAEAFAALGDMDQWHKTAGYVRTRWRVGDSETLPNSGGETAEADDFRAIQDAMREEDELSGAATIPADQVDVDRFHRTWVLGLLLGFEGTALDPDSTRRAALLAMAARAQLPSGAFYPERVPWVTARVVLGLTALGEHAEASKVTDAACRWLRTRSPAGPYSFGVWRPGTGRWNTDLATTAMALLALGRAGVSPADTCVRRGAAFLRDSRAEWNVPGKEIDCAQAVEAALVLGGGWRDFASEIHGLSVWAKDIGAWARVTSLASEVQDESSKISAVAGALVGIIWATVRQELPVLFEGVGRLEDRARGNVVPEPEADEASRLAVLSSLTGLQKVCSSNVADREALVARRNPSDEVREALALWRQLLQGVNALAEHVADPELRAVRLTGLTEQANQLGRQIKGDAWEVLN